MSTDSISNQGSSAAGQGSPAPASNQDSGELYGMVRGLQRQLHLQRSALDAVHSQARETEMKLRQASAALMTAQEMERKRIASELHDSVGSALNSLAFGVGGALVLTGKGDVAGTSAILQRVAQQVKSTLDEVRRIAMDLRPAILDDLGIVGTLSWFMREFGAVYPGIAMNAQVEVAEADVPVALRTPIYRVLQEAMNNMVKHAQATQVVVRLTGNGSNLVLDIQDNGRGFSPEQVRSGVLQAGMGLTGMRDRVDFSGGEFHIDSSSNGGTRIVATWSLLAPDASREKRKLDRGKKYDETR